jgi:hypothetical protein
MPPRIQAIAPGSDVVVVVTFALQCGHVIVIDWGPNWIFVTITTGGPVAGET